MVLTAAFDQPPRVPDVRYAICSSGDTDAADVCQSLTRAGLGVPYEYLNASAVDALCRLWSIRPEQYVQALEHHRTAANGVWGISLTSPAELSGRPKIRYMVRLMWRDPLEQAVYLHRERRLHNDDIVHLAGCVRRIQQDSEAWQRCIDNRPFPVLTMYYEEYQADPAGQMGRVADYLGRSTPEWTAPVATWGLEAAENRLMARFLRLRSAPRTIFLGGLHRSGTSALHRCLSDHPQVSGFHDTGVPEDEGQHLQTVYPPARGHGGPGRFGFDSAAHLTESSPLITDQNRRKLLSEWGQHWNVTSPVRIEKSPPNLIRMRFLQAMVPGALFVVLVRHPVAVSLATRKMSDQDMASLLRHWRTCHETLEADRRYIRHLVVIRYEDFTARPQETLDRVYAAAGLSPHALRLPVFDTNEGYLHEWNSTLSQNPDGDVAKACLELEPGALRYGYRVTP
jgi:hypothetical protein